MQIEVGKPVPEFMAASTILGNFQPQDYKGKYLVLYFYPKDSTPGCTCEANEFAQLYEQFVAANAAVVGVSRDTLISHQKFATQHKLTFPLIADTDSKVCDLFNVINKKSIFGKTALGLVRSTFLIDPAGILIKEWRKVKAAGHAQQVLETILQR